jgi:hypothetical protein
MKAHALSRGVQSNPQHLPFLRKEGWCYTGRKLLNHGNRWTTRRESSASVIQNSSATDFAAALHTARCSHQPEQGADRGKARGLTAAVSTCIGERRGSPDAAAAATKLLLRFWREPATPAATGRRRGEISCSVDAAGSPPLLSREPRAPRGSAAYHSLLAPDLIWLLVCAVRRRLTVWPTEFCSAAFIRRSRNSGRWRCGCGGG